MEARVICSTPSVTLNGGWTSSIAFDRSTHPPPSVSRAQTCKPESLLTFRSLNLFPPLRIFAKELTEAYTITSKRRNRALWLTIVCNLTDDTTPRACESMCA